MTLTLEVTPELIKALESDAEALGEPTAVYAGRLLQKHLSDAQRSRRIDELIVEIGKSNGTLGRDGRPWREISHEGHRY